MELFNEYSLLIAIATPVVVVVAINLVLALTGESGTLLLPSLRGYPAIEVPRIEASPEATAPAMEDEVGAEERREYRRAA